MAIDLPGELVKDIRQPILGDSFSWNGIEPAAAKKRIVIHGTASANAPAEDGFTMADYHVNHNGWGGIGVHLVVTRDDYPGRARFTDPGAQLQYVGDLETWRAGVWGHNPGSIHIEIAGLFTPGHDVPSEHQLRLVRRFIDFILAPNNIMPSLNYPSQVTFHNAIADADHTTECPGWQNPRFDEWFGYLRGGAEPSWWAPAPIPEPSPPPPEATPIPVTVTHADEPPLPTFTYEPLETPDHQPTTRPDAYAVDILTGKHLKEGIPAGTVHDIAGYFTVLEGAHRYVRTVWSRDHDTTTGVPVEFFEPVTGQPSGPVNVTVTDKSPLTDEALRAQFLGLPDDVKATFWQKLWEPLGYLLAILVKIIKQGTK